MGAALMGICMLPMPAYASSPEAIVAQVFMNTGTLKLVMLMIAWLISAHLVARGPSLGRKLLLGLVVLTFFAAQGRSILDTYRNSGLYQRRTTMALSDLQIHDKVAIGRLFGGKKVLPLLVADHIPQAKVFLYDENLYRKELLGWSGRNPDSTFVVGGYQSTMDPSFKVACLGRPHIIYEGLYIATPLSIYENEERVFLMKDALMDYLVPGSWRVSQHE
jgi:hypothetical protein